MVKKIIILILHLMFLFLVFALSIVEEVHGLGIGFDTVLYIWILSWLVLGAFFRVTSNIPLILSCLTFVVAMFINFVGLKDISELFFRSGFMFFVIHFIQSMSNINIKR